jgi:hypothetical protein
MMAGAAMVRRRAMKTRHRVIYALAALLAPMVPTSARAQSACTPVVYAFRHVEDSNALKYPHTLTKTGMRHADLYVSMIDDIDASLGTSVCPVTKVYTINLVKADGSGNTTNPFYTAQPLAVAKTGADPLQTVGSAGSSHALLEYLGNSPDPGKHTSSNRFVPRYDTDVARALRDALVTTAEAGESSAIFWTSQGLHILAGAIIDGDSKVPQKDIDDDKGRVVAFPEGTPRGTPPRNAVYVFPYDAMKGGFDDVTKFDQYVQCYNWTLVSADSETAFRTNLWCGNSNYGDLGGNPKLPSAISDADLPRVRARICNTDALQSPGSAYYGWCPAGGS